MQKSVKANTPVNFGTQCGIYTIEPTKRIMKRACKDESCTQIHEDPKLSQIEKLPRVPSGLFKNNYFRIKLRMIAGMLLLMILSFGVTSKASAAPHRGGYHRYGNSIKYHGGYHGGHHYGHGHRGGYGRGYYGRGHYYNHAWCGGYVQGGRGCRR